MTECTPRPESFPILQPSQSKHSCLPYILLSGWPHQSFDSLLSSPLSWLLLWWEPSHRTAGEPAGCFPASGCPCPAVADGLIALKQIWEGHRWLGNPRWFPAATAQSLNFLARPLRPWITGPNLSAFAQPFLILLILDQPTSLLNWPEFFFLPCLFSCSCLRMPSHLISTDPSRNLLWSIPALERMLFLSLNCYTILNTFLKFIIMQKECWLWNKIDLVLNIYPATYQQGDLK